MIAKPPAPLFNCTPKAPATPATTSKRGKGRKREPLPPEALCSSCSRELAIFWQARAWCIHCEAEALFGREIVEHRQRVANIAKAVAQ